MLKMCGQLYHFGPWQHMKHDDDHSKMWDEFMRGSRKFCQRGPNFDVIFLVDEGREDPSTTISGSSSARQRNAIKWRFAGVPMMAQH